MAHQLRNGVNIQFKNKILSLLYCPLLYKYLVGEFVESVDCSKQMYNYRNIRYLRNYSILYVFHDAKQFLHII